MPDHATDRPEESNTPIRIRPCAAWTDDCQGKKSYDGRLIGIDSRYWPRGGGFHILNTADGSWKGNEDRPEIRPSAVSSIILHFGEPDEYGYGDDIDLVKAHFEGDTEEDVKQQVEVWVEEQVNRVAKVLKREFGYVED